MEGRPPAENRRCMWRQETSLDVVLWFIFKLPAAVPSCGFFLCSFFFLLPLFESYFVQLFLCFHSIRNLTCMQHYSFIRQMTVDSFGIWVVGVFLFVLFFTPIFANADAHVWMAVAQCVVCVHVCVC